MRGLVGLVLGSLALAGCASRVDVTRTFAPHEAAAQTDGRLTAVAVVRGDERLPVPYNAHVEEDRVAWPNDPGEHVHKLRPGDVIEADSDGRIVAVRSAGGVLLRFVPGSASSPDGSDEVRGRLVDDATSITLQPGDRIAMRGFFSPDEHIPGGGHVETSRATGALAAGIGLLLVSYGPSAYVGATSTLKTDRVLLAPVAGPWLDLANRPKCVPPAGSQVLPVDPCIGDTILRAGLIAGGAVQGLAALLVLIGLPSSSHVVYDGDHGVGWTVIPDAGQGSAGVRAVGRF